MKTMDLLLDPSHIYIAHYSSCFLHNMAGQEIIEINGVGTRVVSVFCNRQLKLGLLMNRITKSSDSFSHGLHVLFLFLNTLSLSKIFSKKASLSFRLNLTPRVPGLQRCALRA